LLDQNVQNPGKCLYELELTGGKALGRRYVHLR
jgi:hypothetical protein